MNFIHKLKLIKRIDAMIQKSSTGTPAELARKLDTSERQVYNLINMMKEMQAPIYFCPFKKSYCYEKNVSLQIGFYNDNGKQVYGGRKHIHLDFYSH